MSGALLSFQGSVGSVLTLNYLMRVAGVRNLGDGRLYVDSLSSTLGHPAMTWLWRKFYLLLDVMRSNVFRNSPNHICRCFVDFYAWRGARCWLAKVCTAIGAPLSISFRRARTEEGQQNSGGKALVRKEVNMEVVVRQTERGG
jgi:hypothetical protein